MPPKKRGTPNSNSKSKSNIQTRKPDPSPPLPLQATSDAPSPPARSTAQSLSGGPSANKAVQKVETPSPIKMEVTKQGTLVPAGLTASSQSLPVGPQSDTTGGKSNLKKVVKKVVRKVKKPCLTGGTEPESVYVNSYVKIDSRKVNPTVDRIITANSEQSLPTSPVKAVVKETPVVPTEVMTTTSESLTSGPETNTEKSGEAMESDAVKGKVKKVVRKVIKKKIVKKMVPKGTLAAKKAAEVALGLAEEQAKSGGVEINKTGEEMEKSIITHDVNPSVGGNDGDKGEKSTERAGNSTENPSSELGDKKYGEESKEIVIKIEGDEAKNNKISTSSVNRKEINGGEIKVDDEIQKEKADCSTSNNERKVRKVIKKKIIKKFVPKGTLLAKKCAEENLNVSANSEAESCNPKCEETLIITDKLLNRKGSSNSVIESEQAQGKELTVSNKESPNGVKSKQCSNAETQKGIEMVASREKQKRKLITPPAKQPAKVTVTRGEKPMAENPSPQQGSITTLANKMLQNQFSTSNAGAEEMEGLTERQKRRKTEIFIGGLDKEVGEMDIRTVFGKAGEIVEVRMFIENNTRKNKGYCFLRYKEPAQAKKAISMFSKVEICGKRCGAAPVEDHDSIFLGNIDKRWKKDEIIKMLKDFGIEKIDTVTVMQDPQNPELNRGFAFLDLETNRDAQVAYKKLKVGDFSKGCHVRIDWAQPCHEPDEEEMLKVKSVFVECIPLSWDKAKISEIFEKFGKIERVVLARDIPSSKRKDYAFVNYTNRDAAISCIEFVEKEGLVENGLKVNIKVSLAKPVSKGKMTKGGGRPSASEKDKQKTLQSNKSSIPADRLRALREPAPHQEMGNPKGKTFETHSHSLHGGKRGHSALSDVPEYSDMRGFPRPRYDSSYPGMYGSSSSSYGGVTQPYGIAEPSPFYQNPSFGYASVGSYHGKQSHYPDAAETRERAVPPPHGYRSWPYHRAN
ncbi:uncharacterized protein LOC144574278 isoform X3 [Carex rostrata]